MQDAQTQTSDIEEGAELSAMEKDIMMSTGITQEQLFLKNKKEKSAFNSIEQPK